MMAMSENEQASANVPATSDAIRSIGEASGAKWQRFLNPQSAVRLQLSRSISPAAHITRGHGITCTNPNRAL
jgi:hypothetical protein